jgi:hypothetical protein
MLRGLFVSLIYIDYFQSINNNISIVLLRLPIHQKELLLFVEDVKQN